MSDIFDIADYCKNFVCFQFHSLFCKKNHSLCSNCHGYGYGKIRVYEPTQIYCMNCYELGKIDFAKYPTAKTLGCQENCHGGYMFKNFLFLADCNICRGNGYTCNE